MKLNAVSMYGVTQPKASVSQNKKRVSSPKQQEGNSSLDSVAALSARAGISIAQKTDCLLNELQMYLDKYFLEPEEKTCDFYVRDNIARCAIGNELEGFDDVIVRKKHACLYPNPDGSPDSLYLMDDKGEVQVLDCENGTICHYSKADIDALKYYKLYPGDIHSKLRYGKKYFGSMKKEIDSVINNLSALYSDDSKVMRANEDITLYRALQSNLSSQEKERLSTPGSVFTEKSFCSTTTNIKFANKFVHKEPIMEIEFPKGSKYIDIERMSNIDRRHWQEDEYLLDKNSLFLVKSIDKERNIIKVKYIGN